MLVTVSQRHILQFQITHNKLEASILSAVTDFLIMQINLIKFPAISHESESMFESTLPDSFYSLQMIQLLKNGQLYDWLCAYMKGK